MASVAPIITLVNSLWEERQLTSPSRFSAAKALTDTLVSIHKIREACHRFFYGKELYAEESFFNEILYPRPLSSYKKFDSTSVLTAKYCLLAHFINDYNELRSSLTEANIHQNTFQHSVSLHTDWKKPFYDFIEKIKNIVTSIIKFIEDVFILNFYLIDPIEISYINPRNAEWGEVRFYYNSRIAHRKHLDFYSYKKGLLNDLNKLKSTIEKILKRTQAPYSCEQLIEQVEQNKKQLELQQDHTNIYGIFPSSPSGTETMLDILSTYNSSQDISSHNFDKPLLQLMANYYDPLLPLATLGKKYVSTIVGHDLWNTHFGDIGTVPPLPHNMLSILTSPCPFFPDKKVFETHFLALIPEKINGVPLTLNLFKKLLAKVEFPQKEAKLALSEIINGDEAFGNSHWILMRRAMMKSSGQQREIEEQMIQFHGYSFPNLSEAVPAIFMHFLSTGIFLYNQNTPSSSLEVTCKEKNSEFYGVWFDTETLVVSYNFGDKMKSVRRLN